MSFMLEQNAPVECRDIDTITREILNLKRVAGGAILDIGRRLIQAKELLPHGEWLPWLNEKVEFSERAAQNFMRLSREWTNPQTLADLGTSKALALLALPEDEREEFVAEGKAAELSARELEKAIRERNEARAKAEDLEADLDDLREEVERAKSRASMADLQLDEYAKEVVTLQKELADLKAKPVEVAVEVDQAAIDKAVEEASVELQTQLDAVKEDRAAEIDKLTRHLQTVMAEREQADQALATANRQLADAQAKLEEAQKPKDTAQQDKELAEFEFYFNQAQETANKLRGMLLKARSRGDTNTAEKLKKALKALGEAIGRAAE